MIPELGHVALILALAMAIAQSVLPWYKESSFLLYDL